MSEVKWLDKPQDHDYPDAANQRGFKAQNNALTV
jgi:hypothetical protein